MREALPGAIEVMKPSVDAGGGERRLEVGDVGLDRLVAGVGERPRQTGSRMPRAAAVVDTPDSGSA